MLENSDWWKKISDCWNTVQNKGHTRSRLSEQQPHSRRASVIIRVFNRARVADDQTLRSEVHPAAWKHQECKIDAKREATAAFASCEHLSVIL